MADRDCQNLEALIGQPVISGEPDQVMDTPDDLLDLGGMQVDRNQYPSLQRNAALVKNRKHVLPKPIVIRITVNGHPARALLDSGSLGDFISSTLADQLLVEKQTLESPLPLQLAVQG